MEDQGEVKFWHVMVLRGVGVGFEDSTFEGDGCEVCEILLLRLEVGEGVHDIHIVKDAV